jgi:vacuolar-type H+-ATPase subunit E/Vma4
MKYYFKNLLTAICGRNPYRQELDKLKEEVEKAVEKISSLQASYKNELERAAKAEQEIHESNALLEKQNTHLEYYQDLVDEIKKEYQEQEKRFEKRKKELLTTIDRLRKQ